MLEPSAVDALLERTSGFVWGPFLLIPLLLGTGLYLTVRLRGLQFRMLIPALYLALVKRSEPGGKGDISHFQALMTALAATVGTGNIAGVATAIAAGGPGALFWMWMTGLVGMATKYAEALLSVRFRVVDERGHESGGPMYFLSRGLPWPRAGRILGGAFAAFAAVAAFGIGNGVQSREVANALQTSFGWNPLATTTCMAILVAAVILGGVRAIGRVAGVFVPVMLVFYGLGAMVAQNLGAFYLSEQELASVVSGIEDAVLGRDTGALPTALRCTTTARKTKLTCPADIAYGDQGQPPTIAPGAALAFEVELVEIVE